MAESNLTKLKSIFGFGDDLGFDDFNPDKKPGQSNLTKLKSIYGFGDDLGFDDFDPDNSPLSKIAKQKNKIS